MTCRFDPLKLLDILRDKRLMFIGDSVQRAQFESMVCLVQSVVPKGKKSFKRDPPRKVFKAKVLKPASSLTITLTIAVYFSKIYVI